MLNKDLAGACACINVQSESLKPIERCSTLPNRHRLDIHRKKRPIFPDRPAFARGVEINIDRRQIVYHLKESAARRTDVNNLCMVIYGMTIDTL
jgi:hypothetical protein